MIIFLFLVLVGVYFLPGIIAQSRKVRNAGSIWVINIFLGWTVIGWIIALAMAGRSATPMPIQPIFPPAQPPFRPELRPSRTEEDPSESSYGAYGADGD